MAHTTNMPETWTTFFATPADETKEFSRPGGFKGKAVSPYYLVKRMTERFGLCGKGWKTKHYETRTVAEPGGTTGVFVLLSLLYKEKGDTDWNEVGPQWGGDVVFDCMKPERQKNNLDGTYQKLQIDDESFKKATTDAMSKCASWIGLGGDVHDGMADGNKYVATKPWDVSPEESQRVTAKARAAAVTPASEPKPQPQEQGAEPEHQEQGAEPPVVNGWTLEAQGRFVDLTQNVLYGIFKAGGQPGRYQAEADKWTGRKAKDPADKVLASLEARIATLKTAMAEAGAPANPTDGTAPAAAAPTTTPTSTGTTAKTPQTSPEPAPGTPEYTALASERFNAACARFFRHFEAQQLGDEAALKELVKEKRNLILKTLTFSAGVTKDEQKLQLAAAMQATADREKIPA